MPPPPPHPSRFTYKISISTFSFPDEKTKEEVKQVISRVRIQIQAFWFRSLYLFSFAFPNERKTKWNGPNDIQCPCWLNVAPHRAPRPTHTPTLHPCIIASAWESDRHAFESQAWPLSSVWFLTHHPPFPTQLPLVWKEVDVYFTRLVWKSN